MLSFEHAVRRAAQMILHLLSDSGWGPVACDLLEVKDREEFLTTFVSTPVYLGKLDD